MCSNFLRAAGGLADLSVVGCCAADLSVLDGFATDSSLPGGFVGALGIVGVTLDIWSCAMRTSSRSRSAKSKPSTAWQQSCWNRA